MDLDLISYGVRDMETGEQTITLTEAGREALADLLDYVAAPAPESCDPLRALEVERVTALAEELRRHAE